MRHVDADALWMDIIRTMDYCDDILEIIERQPTIEERKTGKWISDRLVTTSGGTYGVRRCSECGAYYQDVGYGWNYCPNCGADMRGEKDGN